MPIPEIVKQFVRSVEAKNKKFKWDKHGIFDKKSALLTVKKALDMFAASESEDDLEMVELAIRGLPDKKAQKYIIALNELSAALAEFRNNMSPQVDYLDDQNIELQIAEVDEDIILEEEEVNELDLEDPPILFRAAHLQFTTHKSPRTPTFYFDDGITTARLRTDHPSGPIIIIDAYRRTHFFFRTMSDRDEFRRKLKLGETVAQQGGPHTTRTPGYAHYEVGIDLQDKKIGKGHSGEGLLVLNINAYTDDTIKIIYHRIKDHMERGDRSAIKWDDLPDV